MKRTYADAGTEEAGRVLKKIAGFLSIQSCPVCVASARARSTLFALSRGLDFPQPVALLMLVNHAFLAALADLEKRARRVRLQDAVSFSLNCEVKFHGLTFGKTLF